MAADLDGQRMATSRYTEIAALVRKSARGEDWVDDVLHALKSISQEAGQSHTQRVDTSKSPNTVIFTVNMAEDARPLAAHVGRRRAEVEAATGE